MKEKATLLVALILTLGIAHESRAQVDLKKVGQSTMNFLKVSVSPKAAAMGNARTVLSDDAGSMFYNPAGLANVGSGYDIFLSRTQWIANINYTAGSVARSFGTVGTFAVSVLSVDYGDIPRTVLLASSDPQGFRREGNLNIGAFAVGLGYARQISTQFQMGAQLQYVGQTLGQSQLEKGMVTNQKQRVTGNFGIKFYPGWNDFRFGMTIRNFSSQVEYEEVGATLPIVFIAGAGIDMLDVVMPARGEGTSFLLSAEFIHPNNYTERVNLGGEYTLLNNLISLRAGYQFNRDLQGFGAGFGLTPSLGDIGAEINYSYNTMDVFDGVNRFSLGLSF